VAAWLSVGQNIVQLAVSLIGKASRSSGAKVQIRANVWCLAI